MVDGEIEGAFHCEYADLDALLPECTAIVQRRRRDRRGRGDRERRSSLGPRSISTTTVNVSRVAAWARHRHSKDARRAGRGAVEASA